MIEFIKKLLGYRIWYLYSPTGWNNLRFRGKFYGTFSQVMEMDLIFSSKKELSNDHRKVEYDENIVDL